MASKLLTFLRELKRRKVYQIAAIYAGVGLAVALGASELFEALLLPDWTPRLVLFLLILGFPVALVLAWAYEVRPEGSPSGQASDHPIPSVHPPAASTGGGTTAQKADSDRAAPKSPEAPGSGGIGPGGRIVQDQGKSIAVLSFLDMSPERDQEYFCDGMAEEIINGLTKVQGLRVAARTSSFYFKGRSEHVRDIGERLGVRTVLEGSVRRSGDRLRVTAQLVSTEDGYHLWSETFDRELKDVFEIQDEIARSIVETLRPTLLGEEGREMVATPMLMGEEGRELVVAPTRNMEAYDHYLRGSHLVEGRDESRLNSALRHFERAVEIDPDFAPPYAGLANAFTALGLYGYLPPEVARKRAGSAARRALELGEDLSDAHASMGFYQMLVDRDWERAADELCRAIALNPSHAKAHVWLGYLRGAQGRFPEAFREMETARRLDPFNDYVTTLSATAHAYAGDFPRAAGMLEGVLEHDPTNLWAVWILSWVYLVLSRHEEAVEMGRRGVVLSNQAGHFKASLGIVCGGAGRREEARTILDELHATRSSRYVSPVWLCWIHTVLGEEERALEFLEEAVGERSGFLHDIHQNPMYSSLWGNPRFRELAGRVGSGVASRAWERWGDGSGSLDPEKIPW